MKVLFVAPQPFFQERGTPIAVRLAVAVLAKRPNTEVHLLTYHEGEDVEIPNLQIKRMWGPGWLTSIGPGISWKKLLCDFFLAIEMLKLLWLERKNPYSLIHAVEESVFLAWAVRLFSGIPYIYDMDSSLALQLTEKWYVLRPLLPLCQFFEKIAVKGSVAVVPVCDSLAEIAVQHGSQDTHILRDVSLINPDQTDIPEDIEIRKELGLSTDSLLVLYIGNLESYQGIDLLLESFENAFDASQDSHLVIIGGVPEHIEAFRKQSASYSSQKHIHFMGPRPVSLLSEYLAQANILASPRTKGNNTPMKIYSYLHSGIPTIATNLPTHTQVLNKNVAKLASPNSKEFGQALKELLSSKQERTTLGNAARKLAEENYTFEVFSRRLNELYDRISQNFSGNQAVTETS